MKNQKFLTVHVAVLAFLLLPQCASALIFGYFPGLDELVVESDAIVVVEISGGYYEGSESASWSTYKVVKENNQWVVKKLIIGVIS